MSLSSQEIFSNRHGEHSIKTSGHHIHQDFISGQRACKYFAPATLRMTLGMTTSLMPPLYQRKVKTNITEKEPRPNIAEILRTRPNVPRFSGKKKNMEVPQMETL
jgi:hypothetical protein